MAQFVHLAAAADALSIRRNGISRVRPPWGEFPGGCFAVPQSPNFVVTHQWLRELARRGRGPFIAVDFRIPDDERVWVGRYNESHQWMTAAEAVAVFLDDGPRLGWEVIIPRRVRADEVRRIRLVRQVLGWRYSPGVHRKRPCACDYCTGGTYGARKIRERAAERDRQRSPVSDSSTRG